MKSYILTVLFTCCISGVVYSQQSVDLALQVTVTFQASPPAIVLSWAKDSGATNVIIHRKLKQDAYWTSTFTLAGTAVSYTDTNIIPGMAYEYGIAANSNPAKTAYLYAGNNIPVVHSRGKVILMVDNAYSNSLFASIQQLINDLIGDGWRVIRHDVSRNDSVTVLKNLIKNDYLADSTSVKALFLLGHVPIPYSGNLNPDGHPDHLGAWPADVYYAGFNGVYTDATVNDTAASSKRNWNVPGDGKFDQTSIPGNIVLQTGRVDLFNMPAFSSNDTMLIQKYLQKDHAFRFKINDPERNAIIDDNFGYFSGEAFAADGWRNFFALTGDTSKVKSGDYFTGMKNNSYIWSYGCGGGSYTSCSGVGNTSDFVADTVQNIFTMLFGSYFGDWDSQNNFLRAPLASNGWTLSSCWGGRPYWMFHHTGLGETIGFSALTTQNNSYTYLSNYGGKYVHLALMGDPTLRIHVVAPASGLAISAIHNNEYAHLSWTASADSVLGYYIYRAAGINDSFALITPSFITITTFTDSFPPAGMQVYMVRAAKTETVPTGSYINLSQGIMDSTKITTGIAFAGNSNPNVEIFPNPFITSVTIKITNVENSDQLQLRLMDALGREVQRTSLKSPSNQPGISEVTIERAAMVSGIYFYQIISNVKPGHTIVATGKLIAIENK